MHDDARIQRYLEGLARQDQAQQPPGRPGDPQIAALSQYLQTKEQLVADDIVLDYGAGAGMLAFCMTNVWADGVESPWYFAVDRADSLDRLAIPTGLHNHSRKIPAERFTKELGAFASRIKVVVVRNVLHELDIGTTADLVSALARTLPVDCEIYIQDFARLPHGERVKVAWRPSLLKDALSEIGLSCSTPIELESKSGTEWFVMIAHPTGRGTEATKAARAIANAREKQRTLAIDELQDLGRESSEATTADFLFRQSEEASIATQLQQWSYTRARQPAVAGKRTFLFDRVPLVNIPLAALDYVDELDNAEGLRSGLRAIVSSKNLLDFPVLLAECKQRAFFAGYSQRSLLLNEQNRVALRHAIVAGAELRILLARQDSAAVEARATSLAYSSKDDLVDDIAQTQRAFAAFRELVVAATSADVADARCRLKFTGAIPPCSYFIVDDLCFVSLYSQRLTGGSGPCLVFCEGRDGPNAYFSVLLQEFGLAWEDPT